MANGRLLHPRVLPIELPEQKIAEFCERWQITELALFGSVLRDDFRPDSDLNVLVEFEPGTRHGMFDLMQMEAELREIFHRDVLVATRRGVELSTNPLRRKEILETAEVVYARR